MIRCWCKGGSITMSVYGDTTAWSDVGVRVAVSPCQIMETPLHDQMLV
jgi:hypothetical protein